eukprot:CAMPEP_0174310174 /NCGR_PEP_ID=MMETSP0810-20121108/2879_1 /TAXON_ID=73025 ORGANISM="Eutreptiella gymnastica-like, Strain CCMP1594" /NCGR_SAMPLE_ID=MMETSP0810 /ASSEMBLY_ACC=CAM_ASM_000659 /LENGTH=32 /DNA_ID= /DNA_START= /DNA_END= /DNA_ORIENTATION=
MCKGSADAFRGLQTGALGVRQHGSEEQREPHK